MFIHCETVSPLPIISKPANFSSVFSQCGFPNEAGSQLESLNRKFEARKKDTCTRRQTCVLPRHQPGKCMEQQEKSKIHT